MPLDFPASPVPNETYTYGNITYVFDGQKWTSRGTASGLPLLPDENGNVIICLLYTSPSPRDATLSLMPSSA